MIDETSRTYFNVLLFLDKDSGSERRGRPMRKEKTARKDNVINPKTNAKTNTAPCPTCRQNIGLSSEKQMTYYKLDSRLEQPYMASNHLHHISTMDSDAMGDNSFEFTNQHSFGRDCMKDVTCTTAPQLAETLMVPLTIALSPRVTPPDQPVLEDSYLPPPPSLAYIPLPPPPPSTQPALLQVPPRPLTAPPPPPPPSPPCTVHIPVTIHLKGTLAIKLKNCKHCDISKSIESIGPLTGFSLNSLKKTVVEDAQSRNIHSHKTYDDNNVPAIFNSFSKSDFINFDNFIYEKDNSINATRKDQIHNGTESAEKRFIVHKEMDIPSSLVPTRAYKKGVIVSLPRGKAVLKCIVQSGQPSNRKFNISEGKIMNSHVVTKPKVLTTNTSLVNASKSAADKKNVLVEEAMDEFGKDIIVSLYGLALKDIMDGMNHNVAESTRKKMEFLDREKAYLEKAYPGVTSKVESLLSKPPTLGKKGTVKKVSNSTRKSSLHKRSKIHRVKVLLSKRRLQHLQDKAIKTPHRGSELYSEFEPSKLFDGECNDVTFCEQQPRFMKHIKMYMTQLDSIALEPYKAYIKTLSARKSTVKKSAKVETEKLNIPSILTKRSTLKNKFLNHLATLRKRKLRWKKVVSENAQKKTLREVVTTKGDVNTPKSPKFFLKLPEELVKMISEDHDFKYILKNEKGKLSGERFKIQSQESASSSSLEKSITDAFANTSQIEENTSTGNLNKSNDRKEKDRQVEEKSDQVEDRIESKNESLQEQSNLTDKAKALKKKPNDEPDWLNTTSDSPLQGNGSNFMKNKDTNSSSEDFQKKKDDEKVITSISSSKENSSSYTTNNDANYSSGAYVKENHISKEKMYYDDPKSVKFHEEIGSSNLNHDVLYKEKSKSASELAHVNKVDSIYEKQSSLFTSKEESSADKTKGNNKLVVESTPSEVVASLEIDPESAKISWHKPTEVKPLESEPFTVLKNKTAKVEKDLKASEVTASLDIASLSTALTRPFTAKSNDMEKEIEKKLEKTMNKTEKTVSSFTNEKEVSAFKSKEKDDDMKSIKMPLKSFSKSSEKQHMLSDDTKFEELLGKLKKTKELINEEKGKLIKESKANITSPAHKARGKKISEFENELDRLIAQAEPATSKESKTLDTLVFSFLEKNEKKVTKNEPKKISKSTKSALKITRKQPKVNTQNNSKAKNIADMNMTSYVLDGLKDYIKQHTYDDSKDNLYAQLDDANGEYIKTPYSNTVYDGIGETKPAATQLTRLFDPYANLRSHLEGPQKGTLPYTFLSNTSRVNETLYLDRDLNKRSNVENKEYNFSRGLLIDNMNQSSIVQNSTLDNQNSTDDNNYIDNQVSSKNGSKDFETKSMINRKTSSIIVKEYYHTNKVPVENILKESYPSPQHHLIIFKSIFNDDAKLEKRDKNEKYPIKCFTISRLKMILNGVGPNPARVWEDPCQLTEVKKSDPFKLPINPLFKVQKVELKMRSPAQPEPNENFLSKKESIFDETPSFQHLQQQDPKKFIFSTDVTKVNKNDEKEEHAQIKTQFAKPKSEIGRKRVRAKNQTDPYTELGSTIIG